MSKVGLLVRLEAKPGKEDDVAAFLNQGLKFVMDEPAVTTWFALRFSPSSFGIFDTFTDGDGRDAHLRGRVAEALKEKVGELFSKIPVIEKVDILAAKLPK